MLPGDLDHWLDENGTVFVVVFPMLVGLFLVLWGRVRWARGSLAPIALATLAVVFAVDACMVWRVYHGHESVHQLGGWAMPLGIGYRLDTLSAPFLLLISLVALSVGLFLLDFVGVIQRKKQGLFLALYLFAVSGFTGLVLTQDAFNIFVFLEIVSLASCALIAFGPDKRAFYGAYNYLLVGGVGAGFYVIGVAFLYMGTGVLSLPDIHQALLGSKEVAGLTRIAFCFVIIGLLIKAFGFFTHHLLSQVYVSAPGPITGFFSGVTSKVVFYLMLRYLLCVFDLREGSFEHFLVHRGLLFIGIVGMVLPALFACFENDMRRLLAYSSVSQISYLFTGLSFVSPLALSASVFQAVAHGLAKSGLFLTSGFIEQNKGHCLLHRLRGYLRSFPVLSFFTCLSCASLMGLPVTLGFSGKFFLLQSAWEQPFVFVLVVLSSSLAFFYSARLVNVLFVSRPEKEGKKQPAAAVSVSCLYLALSTSSVASLVCVFGGRTAYELVDVAMRGLLREVGG